MRALALVVVAILSAAPASSESAVPTFFVERVEISGVERVSAAVIAAESRLTEGREYNEQQLHAANDRLRRLPFVLDATFALQKGSERDRYVLVISIKEAKPFFYRADLVVAPRHSSDAITVFSPNDAVVGARFFAGTRGAFHFGMLTRYERRPFSKSFTLLQAGYTHYDVLGTGALATVAINQVLSLPTTNKLLPEALIAVPVSPNQTVTVSYTARAVPSEDERVVEARWSYNTTNDPFFPTRGSLLSVGPVASFVDGSVRPPGGAGGVPFESRAVGLELEGKRHWELGFAMSLGAEMLAGFANIRQRRNGIISDSTQSYGEGVLRLSRALSTDPQSPSRIELTLRRSGNAAQRSGRESTGVTEMSVSWAKRNAWGALRLGAGYTW